MDWSYRTKEGGEREGRKSNLCIGKALLVYTDVGEGMERGPVAI